MKYLQLLCANGITGPIYGEVNFEGKIIQTWYVSGYGYIVDQDENGTQTIISGPANYLGVGVDPKYRELKCSGGGDPDESITFGVDAVEELQTNG